MTYPDNRNGRMQGKYLKRRGSLVFEIHTAAALSAAETGARAAGIKEFPYAKPAGGYRSRALQALMRAFPGHYNVLKVNGHYIPQASVGYSTHGWGTAVDINPGSFRNWMIQHGHDYGFSRTNPVGDPGHFYRDH